MGGPRPPLPKVVCKVCKRKLAAYSPGIRDMPRAHKFNGERCRGSF